MSSVDTTVVELQSDKTEIQSGTETILIIDDEEMIRDLVREFLASYGYIVYCAGSGEEGLDLLTRDEPSPIELVILDLNMPGMGGFKCL